MNTENHPPIRVLVVCSHNSARSQMAEMYINALGKGKFFAESAGLEPTQINPLVVDVMKEEGFDLSNNTSDSVFEFFKQGRIYNYVITVCSETDRKCPVFPGIQKRMSWPFPDPEHATGSPEDQLAQVRQIRDAIKQKVTQWIQQFNQ